ncbi:hypothetical protein [Flexibacterium corallicola]|uniref:hypothetical protein n=1 Tax=Flexibacterium corallicola TaxID=3037259 RepID=UPI00286FAAC5|nr:hypothetical protein [Pseudovibrio sp. M1P-2-3]
MQEFLTIAMEYVTHCHGTCQTCVLSRSERAERSPHTKLCNITKGIEAIASSYAGAQSVALGIGRANILDLEKADLDNIQSIIQTAERNLSFHKGYAEITTSLIGKINSQIQKAQYLMTRNSNSAFDMRFVVVGNTALLSTKYWQNLRHFMSEISSMRRGVHDQVEDSGDILQLALSCETLPNIDGVLDQFPGHRSVINIVWAPSYDKALNCSSVLRKMEEWLAEFYVKSRDRGIDASFIERVDNALKDVDISHKDAIEKAQESCDSITFIDADGNWHNGQFTILAELDPIRFDREGLQVGMKHRALADANSLFRNKECRRCEFRPACISSGAFKFVNMINKRLKGQVSGCPAGIRKTFEIGAGYV